MGPRLWRGRITGESRGSDPEWNAELVLAAMMARTFFSEPSHAAEAPDEGGTEQVHSRGDKKQKQILRSAYPIALDARRGPKRASLRMTNRKECR
jgi:hypothetical protein